MPHAHGSLMAAELTDTDEQSDDNSSVSAPAYSPLTVSSVCSEVLHDDLERDSEEEASICGAEEQGNLYSDNMGVCESRELGSMIV